MNHQENEPTLYYSTLSHSSDHTSEEVLVADSRDGQSPAQAVERKLVSMLQNGQVLMSHLQSHRTRGPAVYAALLSKLFADSISTGMKQGVDPPVDCHSLRG